MTSAWLQGKRTKLQGQQKKRKSEIGDFPEPKKNKASA
jgi:hypothetical protein